MSYREKINIYVPEAVGAMLNNDAALFEVFKKDGYTINRNRFLSLLIIGYYSAYVSECRQQFENLQDELQKFIPKTAIREEAAESILNRVIMPEIPKRKGKNPVKLSLKPTAETDGIIMSITDGLSADDYVSQYFCRMFMSYAKKPLYERERLIFSNNAQMLMSACESNRPITFTTIWNTKIVHEVVPYELAVGQDEMFNYLLCQERNIKTGILEARAYRLNRITRINFSASTANLTNEIVHYLELMKRSGAQYPINDEDEICVRLTDYGVISYNRIYHGRPKYERIEHTDTGHLYYFQCSKDQVFFYFRRFEAGAAEVLYPETLRERMIRFHTMALEAYGNTGGNGS